MSGFGIHTVPDSHRIKKYSLWGADSKYSGFASEFAGYVWTEGVSGKKKLRIKKYPDTCIGLSPVHRYLLISGYF